LFYTKRIIQKVPQTEEKLEDLDNIDDMIGNDDVFDAMPDVAPPGIEGKHFFFIAFFRVFLKNQHSIMIDFDLNDLDGLEDIDAELARVEAELAKVQGGNKVRRFD
jgi:hypothetical protein